MSGQSQKALYALIETDLSWSEQDLPQAERTKHVHSLHPYLGKFIPQLVEVFLNRYFRRGDVVFDPFVCSGTTLVEANAFGADAIGCDISAFNCLLSRVKTTSYSLGVLNLQLRGILEAARRNKPGRVQPEPSNWMREWYAPNALAELSAYYTAAAETADDPAWDVARVILSRSARSARLTTHFDLDFPRTPVTGPYHCHKHKRTCRPVQEAQKFLGRYTEDTMRRIREFASIRGEGQVEVLHADARTVVLPTHPTGVITSPPYPGLIDYHEQHRYAYELLDLEDRRDSEIGPAVSGVSKAAIAAYVNDMTSVFSNATAQLPSGAPVIIIVNDSRSLYPQILSASGLAVEETVTRHVNRRTGRRAGEFYEQVLICRSE